MGLTNLLIAIPQLEGDSVLVLFPLALAHEHMYYIFPDVFIMHSREESFLLPFQIVFLPRSTRYT